MSIQCDDSYIKIENEIITLSYNRTVIISCQSKQWPMDDDIVVRAVF